MVELLAPAGSREALVAAVESGADAIYLAGSKFGARAYADNFDGDGLKEAVDFAHRRGVRIHVTVNTVMDDSEIPALKEYLHFLCDIGADAVLVQDLGAARVVRETVPGLPMHASTQMTVHNLDGVRAMEALGFSRVVLSRELSLEAIRHICAEAKAEIEVFVHGALCVCYSGQCLMSSMIGGRSGNRGRCAQPCRLPYELVDENDTDQLGDTAGKYLLSPRDMNTIELLPELLRAGVSSLKIEGRMKRPEYVAVAVGCYRRAVDQFLSLIQKISNKPYNGQELVGDTEKNNLEGSASGLTAEACQNISVKAENRAVQEFQVNPEDKKALAQIFNRDFTTAYLDGKQGRLMMSDKRPNNRGLMLGRVVTYDAAAGLVALKLTAELNQGDQVDFWVKAGGRVTATVQEMSLLKETKQGYVKKQSKSLGQKGGQYAGDNYKSGKKKSGYRDGKGNWQLSDEGWNSGKGQKNGSLAIDLQQLVPVTQAKAGDVAVFSVNGRVFPGDRAFKVYDALLMDQAKSMYNTGAPVRRFPLWARVQAAVGQPLTITVRDEAGHEATAQTAFIGQEALKRPLDYAAVEKQLKRLGTSIFELAELQVDIQGQVMVPVSEINEARRQCVEELEGLRLADFNAVAAQERQAAMENVLAGKRLLEEKVAGSLESQMQAADYSDIEIQNLNSIAGQGQDVNTHAINEEKISSHTKSLLEKIWSPGMVGQGIAGRSTTSGKGDREKKFRQKLTTVLTAVVDDLPKLRAALAAVADRLVFGGESYGHQVITLPMYKEAVELAHQAGRQIVFNTPRIIRDGELTAFHRWLEAVSGYGADGISVHNIGTLYAAKSMSPLPIEADYSLISYNGETLRHLWEMGAVRAVLSPELNFSQLENLVREAPLPVECLAEGNMELMVSEYCCTGSFLGGLDKGNCSRPCLQGKKYFLRDRKQVKFPLVMDQYCHMHVLNANRLSMLPHVDKLLSLGVAAIRLEGRYMTSGQLKATLDNYKNFLQLARANGEFSEARRQEAEKLEGTGITRGHYFRGVL